MKWLLGGAVVWTVLATLHLPLIELLPTNRVCLGWSSSTGEVCAVERTEAMTASFVTIALNLTATPPQNVFTDVVPAHVQSVFYRVRATVPETNGWQHAHDAQRTGYAPAAPPHPWRWAWQGNGSDANGRVAPGKVLLPRNVRPIDAEGRVYIAAGTDGVYALDEHTGAVLRQARPGGATHSTLAYDPQLRVLFAVSVNGKLYKLNPTNGVSLASCILGTPRELPLPVALIPGRLFAAMGTNVLAFDPANLTTNWCTMPAAQCIPHRPTPRTAIGWWWRPRTCTFMGFATPTARNVGA